MTKQAHLVYLKTWLTIYLTGFNIYIHLATFLLKTCVTQQIMTNSPWENSEGGFYMIDVIMPFIWMIKILGWRPGYLSYTSQDSQKLSFQERIMLCFWMIKLLV